MRQRQRRTSVAHSGVERFLRERGGDRRRCAKALYFIATSGRMADDLALLRELRDEFAVELASIGRSGWISRRITELERGMLCVNGQ